MQTNNVLSQVQDITATITTNGMLSLPIAVQKALRVKPGKKITFHIHGKDVAVTAEPYTLESLVGSLTPRKPIKDVEKAIREAKEEHVQYLIDKMSRE